MTDDNDAIQPDTGAGSGGPSTGTSGRDEGEVTGVSRESAVADLNPGSVGRGDDDTTATGGGKQPAPSD